MRILSNSSLVGATVALMAAATATAQVNYSEDFSGGLGGWTGGSGTAAFTGASACGGAGGGIRDNIFFTSANNWSQSPLMGTSLGGNMSLSFDMKVADWDSAGSNNVGTAGWGSLDVQYGATSTGPWTTIATILDTDDVQDGTTCFTKAYNFLPPAGDLYIRLTTTYGAGDYYMNFDNVSCVENLAACSGPVTPGDTLVAGTFCNVGDSVTLSLQNGTSGSGVSYQWLESADDVTYTPFGTDAATQSVMPAGPTYYKCDVTCSTGPVTGTSNSVFVDYDVPAPGNTVASPSVICNAGDPVNLTLDGTLPASATYQWYENGLAVGGATADSFVANPVAASTYYCDVTCGPNTVSSVPVVLGLAGAPTFPQTFSTSELDDCWSEVNGSSDPDSTPKWDASADGYGVGAGSVFYDFWSTSGGQVCQHISPIFAPAAPGTTVYFDVAGKQFSSSADEVALEESTDGGVTWTNIVTMTNAVGGLLNPFGLQGFSPEYIPTASEWSSLSFGLSAGANRIRFVATSDFGNNVYIDNVSVGVVPSARHVAYGTGCAGAYALSSSTPPIDGSLVTFDVTSAPEAVVGSGVYFGVVIVSFGELFPGFDLSAIGAEAGCFAYVSSLDLLLSYVSTTSADSTVDLQLPLGIPAGTYLFEQAAAIVEATPTNPAGLLSSNALRSLVNTF